MYLEFLQKQQSPGPFNQSQHVKEFMEEAPDGKYKNHRMYGENRFQRNTSTSLKKDAV